MQVNSRKRLTMAVLLEYLDLLLQESGGPYPLPFPAPLPMIFCRFAFALGDVSAFQPVAYIFVLYFYLLNSNIRHCIKLYLACAWH